MLNKPSSADLMSLAGALVSIPSVTGEEGALGDFLSGHLSGHGFHVEEQTVDGRRRNILAVGGPSPRVLLCTHQDTVPPFIPASEDEDFLYGRGSCDAKGIMAAMVHALRTMSPEVRAACGLLFVVGEETDSAGAERANSLSVRPEFIIVGEPTENKLGLGHLGYIALRIIARGKKAHSGYPHLGQSAVLKLVDVLQKLRGLDLGQDPVLGRTLLNIGRLEGGVAANVIPDLAWAEVSIRSGLPSRDILDKVREAVAGQAELELQVASEAQKLFTVAGFETTVLSYGTDIPHLRVFGRPLLLGPGSILEAHIDKERISKREMREAAGLYQKLIMRLLSEPTPGSRT